MTALPRISVVINTLNRERSLRDTLESFRWQTYSGQFEVIVVNGPSTDGSQALIESWLPKIRIGRCPAANLSMSRNIDRKSTRLNSSHVLRSRMPSSA